MMNSRVISLILKKTQQRTNCQCFLMYLYHTCDRFATHVIMIPFSSIHAVLISWLALEDMVCTCPALQSFTVPLSVRFFSHEEYTFF